MPVHEEALDLLGAYLQERILSKRSPLFVTHWRKDRSRRVNAGDIESLFRHLSRRMNKHVHPHLLRHTFACHLLQNGMDVRHVQMLLGHDSPDTTSRYLGLVKNQLREAYDAAMANALMGL